MSAHKLGIVKLAAYYEKDLSDEQIVIYAEQVARALSPVELNQAIDRYIDDPENEFFPRPLSKLITLVKAPVAKTDQAQNTVSLIKKAIRFHGQNWEQGHFSGGEFVFTGKNNINHPTWREAAETEIGDLGVEVALRQGGWARLCFASFDQPEGVFTAQLVRLVESVLNIAEVGMLDAMPSLPNQRANELSWQDKKQEQIQKALTAFQIKEVPRIED